jgi:hypothetical protein
VLSCSRRTPSDIAFAVAICYSMSSEHVAVYWDTLNLNSDSMVSSGRPLDCSETGRCTGMWFREEYDTSRGAEVGEWNANWTQRSSCIGSHPHYCGCLPSVSVRARWMLASETLARQCRDNSISSQRPVLPPFYNVILKRPHVIVRKDPQPL